MVGAGPFPRNKSQFECILSQFSTDSKRGQSLEALGHDFTVQLQNEAYRNRTKIIPKFTVRPKGAVAPSPP